jgi:hypothetical protein
LKKTPRSAGLWPAGPRASRAQAGGTPADQPPGRRRSSAFPALALLLTFACRTARLPDEAPLPPLQAASAEDALATLRERMAKLTDVHALVRLRVTTPERVDTFKAAVTVNNRQQMELTIYTPLNTTAATITSDGQSVTIRDALHGETVKATAEDLTRRYGIFLPNVAPSDMALLLLGFPSVADAAYEAIPTGLRRAVIGEMTIEYEPPAVHVTRPGQQVEMTVLDVVGRIFN